MNFGIIGFGKIARKFANSIKFTTEGKIYAIGSRTLPADDIYLKENPNIILYRDYDELLNDKNIGAVYIALPHALHYEWAVKALERKIPVLCEKPAVLTLKEIDTIEDVSKTNGTYFLEALKTKFNSGLEELKKDIACIGRIKELEANFCFDAFSLGDRDSYLFDPIQGGALNDVGSYPIGFALSLLDEEIVSISGGIVLRDGVESHFNANILFANGTKAILEGAIDETKERYARITGENGVIHVPVFNRIQEYTITLNNGSEVTKNIPIAVGDDMTMEVQDFIDDVNNNKTSSGIHSIRDTRRIIEVVEGIRQSAGII